MNKIEISNPKIGLINCIDTPSNPTSNNMLSMAYSGSNTHLGNQATTTIAPVIISNKMTSRLPYGSTMDYSNIATLRLSGIIKQARQIHIFPKIKTSPLILLVVLCNNGCTITLDKQ